MATRQAPFSSRFSFSAVSLFPDVHPNAPGFLLEAGGNQALFELNDVALAISLDFVHPLAADCFATFE
jgi:hypothetical protein